MISKELLMELLSRYPELIEPDLVFHSREASLYGLSVDMLFEDRNGKRLAVLVKAMPVAHEHVGEAVSFQEAVLSSEASDIRMMLVSEKIPENLQTALENSGVEWKEIEHFYIKEYLMKKNDLEMLKLLGK